MVRAAGGAAGLLELGRATEEGLAGLGLDDAAAAAVWAAWPAAVQVGSLSLRLLLSMAPLPSPPLSAPACPKQTNACLLRVIRAHACPPVPWPRVA